MCTENEEPPDWRNSVKERKKWTDKITEKQLELEALMRFDHTIRNRTHTDNRIYRRVSMQQRASQAEIYKKHCSCDYKH